MVFLLVVLDLPLTNLQTDERTDYEIFLVFQIKLPEILQTVKKYQFIQTKTHFSYFINFHYDYRKILIVKMIVRETN